MSDTETREQRRERWFVECKKHTAIANQARTRIQALTRLWNALGDVYSAYEGNEFAQAVNEQFKWLARQCLERRPKLREIQLESDERASRYMELLQNDE